jgi:predicted heme/steroid binding protein
MGMHQAGKDLTEELELAPHGNEVLERIKLIGVLV